MSRAILLILVSLVLGGLPAAALADDAVEELPEEAVECEIEEGDDDDGREENTE